MIEQLTRLVEEVGHSIITGKDALPSQYSRAAATEAAEAIFDGLQGALASGDLPEVIRLLLSDTPPEQSPIAATITTALTQRLGRQFGISAQSASEISHRLVPVTIGALVEKANGIESSSFTFEQVLDSLSGGQIDPLDIATLRQDDIPEALLTELTAKFARAAKVSFLGGLSRTVANLFRS